jgi:hypothetical protein
LGPEKEKNRCGPLLRTSGAPVEAVPDRSIQSDHLPVGASYRACNRTIDVDDSWPAFGCQRPWRSAEEFLSIVAAELSSVKPVGAANAVRAVFRVLNHHVDLHEVEKVRDALPEEVQKLRPADNPASSAT